jgi:hypothetical protein
MIIPSSFAFFPLQRAVDNAEVVKDIEQRVHSLSGVLTAPVGKDDHTEKARRAGLQRLVLLVTRVSRLTIS